MTQFQAEEAAATALELYEAQLEAAAHRDAQTAGESDVRGRHRQLLAQIPEAI